MDSIEIIAIVSVLTAAGFWAFTQWNIIHTKNVLKTFQQEARANADQKIDSAFVRIESLITEKITAIPKVPELPDISGLETRLMTELQTLSSELPDPDELQTSIMEAVNGQLTQLLPAITAGMRTELAYIKREETKDLGRQLKGFGVDIDQLGQAAQGEIMAQATEGATPVQIAALKFLNREISPAYAEENPGTAAFLDLAKLQALQLMQDGGLGLGVTKNTGKPIQSGRNSPFG